MSWCLLPPSSPISEVTYQWDDSLTLGADDQATAVYWSGRQSVSNRRLIRSRHRLLQPADQSATGPRSPQALLLPVNRGAALAADCLVQRCATDSCRVSPTG